MYRLVNFPVLVFVVSVVALAFAAKLGAVFREKVQPMEDGEREDFGVVLTATLTLLALIIGFVFSMAISRYDLRKNYEAAEASAINTEYTRSDLLPDNHAATLRRLLSSYLDQRVLFYKTRSERQLRHIDAQTAQLQTELWAAVRDGAASQLPPTVGLTMGGMNDVMNAQKLAQAASWNGIPAAAWALMVIMAVFCNFLIGYGARKRGKIIFVVLPIVVAVSFFLIADIDSPRGGVIRVHPQNLVGFSQALRAP
jgi:hypothetical protein